MKELLIGFYATEIYLPFSGWSRRWRRFWNRIRKKPAQFLQATKLPEVSWKSCVSPPRNPRIWEAAKLNGNIRISELGILSALAAFCGDHGDLFEIGTFDGRTTLNLALNSSPRYKVYTLDLPPEIKTAFPGAEGERHMVEKIRPGSRYEKYAATCPAAVGRICQLMGDSAVFDFTPFANSCSLVFVDGSHAFDYAISDTHAAMRIVNEGGIIVWHDYGVWEGVTRALEELERSNRYGLRNIRGTSLVYWKKGALVSAGISSERPR